MSEEEIAFWHEMPAVRELAKACVERYQVWQKIYDFEHDQRRLLVGEYRGIPVFFEQRIEWGDRGDKELLDGMDQAMQIAALYVEAALSLNPSFFSTGFDAGYGKNNLPYLLEEVEESGDLYRILVPFSGDAPEIKEAKETAMFRGAHDGLPKNRQAVTPEVQRLLDFASKFMAEQEGE
jgi:hypothetical protein